MSNIDNRIVEMSFENKGFEKGIEESSKSLENFNKALQDTEQNGSGFSTLGGIVDAIGGKFSAFGVMAVGALMRIGSAAVEAGFELVKSLSLDQVMAGFQEYEMKIGAIKVMLAGGRDEAGLPVTLEEVKMRLEELNHYADQTIYSFKDMTANIGKFTNAGVNLKLAVASIKGIANVAAVSGANTEQAARAMYNFAQALSAGYVKYIDWKSIENAQMATVEFKEELLKSAVAAGTLEEAGNGLYKVLSNDGVGGSFKELIGPTKFFNQSLKEQWMTAEVLTATLDRYSDASTEIGAKATEAATKVRTFSQLMQTTKEAIGSGWGMTFEWIFGDFNKATELWTGISDKIGAVVAKSTYARNRLLKIWDFLGGRQAVIDALYSAWDSLETILKSVKEAFSDVFPPLTGKKLSDLSKALKSFIQNSAPTAESLNKIKTIFTGFFNAISLGWKLLSSVFNGILDGIDEIDLFTKGEGFLGLLAKIAAFFTGLNDSAEKANTFVKISEGVANAIVWLDESIKSLIKWFKESEVIAAIADILSAAFIWFKDALGELFTKLVESDSLKTAFDNIKEFFTSVNEIDTTGLTNFKDSMITVFEKIKDVLEPIGTFIVTVLKDIKDQVSEKWNTEGLGGFLDLINTFLTGGLLVGLTNLSNTLASFSGGFTGLSGILGGLKGTLIAWQNELKVKQLTSIAIAIGVLAVSLLVMSFIDPSKIEGASTAILMLMTALVASFAVLQKSMSGSKMVAFAGQLLLLSGAVLVLAIATKALSSIPEEDLKRGLLSIGLILLGFVAFSKLMDNAKGFLTAAASLLVLGIAINIMAGAVAILGSMDPNRLHNGLVSLGLIAGGMAIFAISVSQATKGGELVAAAGAMVILSIAILGMVGAVAILGSMDPNRLHNGLVSLGLIAGGMAIFAISVSQATKSGDLLIAAAAMVVMSVAILAMVGAVSILSAMDPAALQSGLFGLGVIMAEIAVFSMILSQTIKPAQLVIAAAAVLTLGVALLAIGSVVSTLGSMDQGAVIQGLIALAATLGIIVLALIALANPQVLIGAAAMAIMSGAILLLSVAMVALGNMSWAEIGKALIMLVGVFVLLGAAAAVLTPVIPMIMGLAIAIALLGVGIFAVGAGLLLFGMGLTMVAAAGSARIAVLILGIKEFFLLMPFILTQVALALVAFFEVITASAPAIGAALIAVIDVLIALLADTVPKLVELILRFVLDLVILLVELVPKFVEAGLALVLGLIEGLIEGRPPIVVAIYDLIIALLGALAEKIPDLLTAGADLIIAFVEGIGTEIPRVIEAALDTVISFINALADSIRENTPLLLEAVANLCTAFIDGVKAYLKVEEGESIAGSIITGLINGITNGIESVVQTVKDLGTRVLDAIKAILGIKSPSTMMEEVGQYMDLGLVSGISNYSKLVVNATEKLGKDSVEGFSSIMSDLSDILSADMNLSPVITPVLNLNPLTSEVNSLNGLLSSTHAYDLALSQINADNANSNNQNGSSGSQNGQSITNQFNLNGITIRSEADIEKLARELYRKQEDAMRSRGIKPSYSY